MRRRLIALLLLPIAGLVAGLAAGLALRPAPAPAEEEPPGAAAAAAGSRPPPRDFVRLNNQFVVPVVEGGRVGALVILSLSLEVAPGSSEAVYAREPKLRDALLQVLFEHANTGGFRGAFTDSANMQRLRRALLEAAVRVIGAAVSDVLVVDIVRQDS